MLQDVEHVAQHSHDLYLLPHRVWQDSRLCIAPPGALAVQEQKGGRDVCTGSGAHARAGRSGEVHKLTGLADSLGSAKFTDVCEPVGICELAYRHIGIYVFHLRTFVVY